jgi:calcineurin-like phosphoesterase family protein
MIWFTSDTHFGHANIIKYSNRPFTDVDEMDKILIQNWNAKVRPDDTIYHLGDFAFHHFKRYRDQLLGHIHFIKGNHDKEADKNKHRFESYHNLSQISVDGQPIVLCHYAMRVWNKSHHGAWQLYGHSHGSLPDDPNSLSFDVGIDCHNYFPISFDEVKAIMAKKTWKPVDHHE